MRAKRRKLGADFKTKVVLESLKEQMTLQELASKYEVTTGQIQTWKQDFLSNASVVFEKKSDKQVVKSEEDKLYKKIGQLQVEVDFLKDVLGK